ncbi:MAG: hypothetical protein QM751_12960 [Paludibacteraceae bacterium]
MLLNRYGKTKDIANAVIRVYEDDYMQVNELAKKLQADTIYATCQNIFTYIIEHVQYIEDPRACNGLKLLLACM